MPDVFLSYSRKDADFVRRLHATLAEQKRDVWVDWEDIPATADWWKEVCGGIESADAFVFIISPDSVRSDVCKSEIEYAVANNKRLVPLLRREVTDPADRQNMHPAIGSHNWIFFRETDNFDTAFGLLNDAIDTDLSYVRQHTRLLVRAKEWDSGQRNRGFLLQGDDLHSAETWLAEGAAKKPPPSQLHIEYITASRADAVRQQRRLLIGVSIALVISIGLALLSFGLFGESNRQRKIAESAQGEAQAQATIVAQERDRAQSIAVAGQAQFELSGNRQQRGLLLALEAMQKYGYTWQAERALGQAVQNRLEQLELTDHTAAITNVAWSSDSTKLVTGGADRMARVWDGTTGDMIAELSGHTDVVNMAVWSADGTKIVTASDDKTARIWDAATGNMLATLAEHQDKVVAAAWSPDGAKVATASADNTAKIWDAATGKVLFTLSGHAGRVNDVEWSPNGKHLATASADNTAKIWDAATGKAVATLAGGAPHLREVFRAVWSPDGTKIATVSADRTGKVWDGANGALLFNLVGHTNSVTRIAWSPTGAKIATGSDDRTAKIWDGVTGALQFTLIGHTSQITDMAWSPENPKLPESLRLVTVSGSDDKANNNGPNPNVDNAARIWNVQGSGAQLIAFEGHTGKILSVAWSPDGTKIATGSADKTARIWEIWPDTDHLKTFANSVVTRLPLTDEERIQFGLPLSPSDPAPSPIVSCPDVLASRIYPGRRGQVTDDNDTPSNVRRGPGMGYSVNTQILPGQTFQVLEGPRCEDGLAWFRIFYGINVDNGWIAESDKGAYFVKPVDP